MVVKEVPYRDGKLRLRLRILSHHGFGWALIYIGPPPGEVDVVHSAKTFSSPSEALAAGLEVFEACRNHPHQGRLQDTVAGAPAIEPAGE